MWEAPLGSNLHMEGMDGESEISMVKDSWSFNYTFFQKNSEKLITFKSSGNSSVVDHVVVKKEMMKVIGDEKVIPGEECFSQHRLFVMDLA